jgi:hypothetical protein
MFGSRKWILLLLFAFICMRIYADTDKSGFYSDMELYAQPWDTVQAVYADFSYLLARMGIQGAFDENSLRVYLVQNGKPAGNPLPLRFVKDNDYDAKEQASGSVIWMVAGERDPLKAAKQYRIHFDIAEHGKKQPADYGVLPGEPNLVPNPGFEEENPEGVPARTPYFKDGSQREAYEDGRISLDKTVFHSGEKSVKLSTSEGKPGASIVITPAMGYKEQGHNYLLRVQPGRSYRFGYWSRGEECNEPIYVSSKMAMIVMPWIYWYDSKGKAGSKVRDIVSPVRIMEDKLPDSFGWVYNESILSVSPGTVYAMFTIAFPCKSGTVWIDDPAITLAAPQELTECFRIENNEPKVKLQ